MTDAISRILQRSIIAPYYRQHTGVFLFIFFLLFGTEPTLYQAVLLHYYIIEGILTNLKFSVVAVAVWLIYASRTVHFFHRNMQKDSFHFLLTLRAVPSINRFVYLLRMQSILFAPIWIYIGIVSWIAIKEKHYISGLTIILIVVTISLISTFLFHKILKKGIGSMIPRYQLRIPGLGGYLLRFMFSDQLLPLLILKLISFLCLYGLVNISVEYFESRLLWLLYISVLIGHSILIYRNHHFIESKLSFFRNLPLRRVNQFLSIFLVYLVLLIPEIIALKSVWMIQGDIVGYIWLIIAGPAILVFIHCLLYTEDLTMEGYLQLLFGVWIVLIFLSLTSFKWMISTVCFLMAWFIYYSGYYKYEKKAKVEKLD